MKNKAPLALMEQLVMLLVFALAAALCLQIFVFSRQLSDYCGMRSHGITVAQNAAELLKSTGGDLEECAGIGGGTWEEDCWQLALDAGWQATSSDNAKYLLSVTLAEEKIPLLGTADIAVRKITGEELVGFSVSWQEDGNGE